MTILGGQGRDGDDVLASAEAIVWAIGLAFILAGLVLMGAL